MAFAIKTAIDDPDATSLAFADARTMYGGKAIAAGDTVYLFASETGGGKGLIAKALVTSATPTPRRPDVARQTPRVSITVRPIGRATRPLGRRELMAFAGSDGPEGELHFKYYRQATDKIVGLSDPAAAFLAGYF